MKSKRIRGIVLKVILVFTVFMLVITLYNFLDPPPESIFSVKKSLNESLTIGFKHISTEYGRLEYDRYKENIYYFEDENGVAFSVSSSHLGGSPFSTRYTFCSYPDDLLKVAEQSLKNAVSTIPDLQWIESEYHDGYEIVIDNEQDLALAASGVSKAIQAVPPFPIKPQDYQSSMDSGLPFVRVYIQYIDITSGESTEDALSYFTFLCEGEEMPTEEQILEELQRGYDELVEQGKISG